MIVDTPEKSEFAKMCRALRIENGLKQREVASAIGVALSTYGNVESSRWKIVGAHKVAKMVKLYSLAPDRAAALSSACEAVPLSPHGQKVREKWQRQNAARRDSRRIPVLEEAMLGVVFFAITFAPDAELCRCGFDGKLADSDRACEICEALAALGLAPFSTRDALIADASKLLGKLEAAREKAAAGTAAGAAP